MPNPNICKPCTCFGFIIGIFRIKRKPVLPRNPDQWFQVQITCYLYKLNAFRQAFHERKKLASVSSKLKNVINSYYLRPVPLDHIKDLLAPEHILMGNLSVLEDSKGISWKFPYPRRTSSDIYSIDNPVLHERLYFIFYRIYI